ncbi:MAG TPA: hypothetical protein VMT35_01080, partial [Ignavibacteriaceae bacterium]|nr:hypothetical protein [Ignavibacteriaceae bacterium]
MANNKSITVFWIKWLIYGSLLLLSAYLSFKILHGIGCLWALIFLSVFMFFLVSGFKSGAYKLKIFFFSTAAAFLALCTFESILWLQDIAQEDSLKIETGNFKSAYGIHPYLGYGSIRDGVFTAKIIYNKKIIYDAIYRIKGGLRDTPNSNEESGNCALFFGCSFTFGSGLADTSTLPYLFNQCSNRNYKVYNYGFEGYGPHQMLAIIENRLANDIKNYKNKKVAVYSFIPEHIRRAAGYS